jgi:hypothetical protein
VSKDPVPYAIAGAILVAAVAVYMIFSTAGVSHP